MRGLVPRIPLKKETRKDSALDHAFATLRHRTPQVRQPVLPTGGRTIASVSPQEKFLHHFSQLDTLGVDLPETKCRMK